MMESWREAVTVGLRVQKRSRDGGLRIKLTFPLAPSKPYRSVDELGESFKVSLQISSIRTEAPHAKNCDRIFFASATRITEAEDALLNFLASNLMSNINEWQGNSGHCLPSPKTDTIPSKSCEFSHDL